MLKPGQAVEQNRAVIEALAAIGPLASPALPILREIAQGPANGLSDVASQAIAAITLKDGSAK